ncbi:MAG TPA: hypothetical protein VLN44_03835 [Pyrinomonadaceae bacterium]|nr:hypothetical protein [Pyrinomonadaceae bacterium]
MLFAVPIEGRSTFQAGTPKPFFNDAFDLHSNSGQTFDVDPRSGRLLMTRPPKDEGATTIKIVLNWFSELRRLAPDK